MKIQFNDEQQEILKDIIGKISHKNAFGLYDADDIAQEMWIIAYDGLQRFKPEFSSFRTFMYTHINNRIINFKKKHAIGSHLEDKVKVEYPMSGLDIDNAKFEDYIESFAEILDGSVIFDKIDLHLHSELREDYLRTLDGITLNNMRKEKLLESIRKILEHYCDKREQEEKAREEASKKG